MHSRCFVAVLLAMAAALPAPSQTPAEEAARAQQLASAGKLEEAIAIYSGLLASSPDNAVLLLNLSIVEYKAGLWKDSAAHSDGALQRQPGLLPARLMLGAARIEMGEFAAALEPLEQVVAGNARERNARLMLGEALLGMGRTADAIAHLAAATELLPENPRAWYALASALEAAGQADEASRAWARLEALPDSAERRQHAARVHDAAQRWQLAAAEWRAALALAPTSRRARLGLAGSLFRARDYAPAMAALEPLLLLPASAAAEAHFLYGASLLNLQQPVVAIPHLRAAQSMPAARAALGQALLQTGQAAEAVPLLKNSLATDADGTVHFQLFRAYQLLHRDAEAREMLEAYRRMRSAP